MLAPAPVATVEGLEVFGAWELLVEDILECWELRRQKMILKGLEKVEWSVWLRNLDPKTDTTRPPNVHTVLVEIDRVCSYNTWMLPRSCCLKLLKTDETREQNSIQCRT